MSTCQLSFVSYYSMTLSYLKIYYDQVCQILIKEVSSLVQVFYHRKLIPVKAFLKSWNITCFCDLNDRRQETIDETHCSTEGRNVNNAS